MRFLSGASDIIADIPAVMLTVEQPELSWSAVGLLAFGAGCAAWFVERLRTRHVLRRTRAQLAAARTEAARFERERTLLLELVQLHSKTDAPRALLRKVTEKLADALAFDRLAVYLSSGDALELRALHMTSNADAPRGHEAHLVEGGLARLVREHEVVVIDHAATDARTADLPDYLSVEGWLALVPIVREGRLIGLVAAGSNRAGPCRPEKIPFLVAFAGQIGLSLEQNRLIRQLRELSTHDELTGLANRRLLTSRLQAEAFRGERFGHTTAAIAIDIDHFKQLNDRHGHKTGDAALVAVARLLGASVRKVDLVSRVGGEEFVIVLPRTNIESALIVAEKLRVIVECADLPGGSTQPGGHLTISLGVSVFNDEYDPEVLLVEADRAMYQAKSKGRNRVEVSQPHADGQRTHNSRGAA